MKNNDVNSSVSLHFKNISVLLQKIFGIPLTYKINTLLIIDEYIIDIIINYFL